MSTYPKLLVDAIELSLLGGVAVEAADELDLLAEAVEEPDDAEEAEVVLEPDVVEAALSELDDAVVDALALVVTVELIVN
jgi:hypothetical protein